MRLMLVLEDVPVALVTNQAMLAVFNTQAAQSVPAGYALGECYMVDTPEMEGSTCSVVWDVLDVRTPA